jgi:hypothetical protein
MSKNRILNLRGSAGAAILGALLVGAAGFSAPAFAQEKEQAEAKEKDGKVIRNVIVKRTRDGKPIILDGRELAELKAKCEGAQKVESDVSSGDDKNKFRTRVVICGNKGEQSAELNEKLVAALEKARNEMGDHREMSSERRAQAIEALEREIARLRSQKK